MKNYFYTYKVLGKWERNINKQSLYMNVTSYFWTYILKKYRLSISRSCSSLRIVDTRELSSSESVGSFAVSSNAPRRWRGGTIRTRSKEGCHGVSAGRRGGPASPASTLDIVGSAQWACQPACLACLLACLAVRSILPWLRRATWRRKKSRRSRWRLAGWLDGWLDGWMAGWLVDRPAGWLAAGWLAGWLEDW